MTQLYVDAGPPAVGQKVCLCTTAYDGLDASHVFSLQKSRMALHEAGCETAYILLQGNPHVDDARNTVVKEFLLTDATDLVFLDADVSWDTEDLVQLCSYDQDIVGGVYPYRKAGSEKALPVRPLLDGAHTEDGLLEVEGLPTGFLRIRRRVLAKMAETAESFITPSDPLNKTPILFERTFEGGLRFGGDIAFCRKWREMGGRVYAAPELMLGHAGKSVHVDSMGAMSRRLGGVSLAYVAKQVREGRDEAKHYAEAFRALGNEFAATPEVLMAAVAFARKADGPILEAGSGLSTILMAAATDQKVWCLEHDPTYAGQTKDMACAAGVSNIALVVNPLKGGWYDLSEDLDKLPDRFAFALCDGPPRALGDRMELLRRFGDKVGDIVCDDADDPVYRQQLKQWAAESGREYIHGSHRAAILKGA